MSKERVGFLSYFLAMWQMQSTVCLHVEKTLTKLGRGGALIQSQHSGWAQEDLRELEDSQGCTERPYLEKPKTKPTNNKKNFTRFSFYLSASRL